MEQFKTTKIPRAVKAVGMSLPLPPELSVIAMSEKKDLSVDIPSQDKKEAERKKKDDEGADLNGRTLGAYRDLLFYSNAYATLGGETHGWMKN